MTLTEEQPDTAVPSISKFITVPVGSATPALGVSVAVMVNEAPKLLGSGNAVSVPDTGWVLMPFSSTVMPPVFTSGLTGRVAEVCAAPPSTMGLEMVAPPLATTTSGLLPPRTFCSVSELMPCPAR
ncbi:MAG: hypothetical protein ABSF57_06090, partial [Acidobacteriaceae bacterium]